MRGVFLFVAGAMLVACASVDEQPLPPFNRPPEAALRAPVIAPVGSAAAFDASASRDPDGDVLTYVFEFNDGNESLASTQPAVLHTFEASGLYTVVVRVRDLHGATAIATQDVATRTDYPDPPNFCSAAQDCAVGDECDAGVCYANGGAAD